jgi:hypothetical protein
MALTKKKLAAIKKSAEDLAAHSELSKAEKEAAIDAYQKVVSLLNTKLEEQLEQFLSAALKDLRETYGVGPNAILGVAKTQQERLRELSQHIVNCLEPIKANGFRRLTADYIKSIIDEVYDCTVFKDDLISFNEGEKLN